MEEEGESQEPANKKSKLDDERYNCPKCPSTFREKKNLSSHLKSKHNLRKCNECNYTCKDLHNLRKHEKSAHTDYLLRCKECDYSTDKMGNLEKHINAKHTEKSIRCNQCNYTFSVQQDLIRHVNTKHILKSCNECEFTTLSSKELKSHKEVAHEPDEGEEQSVFDKTLYKKTWMIQGIKDPLSAFGIYKAKIKNIISDYLEKKGPLKFYIGMQIRLQKEDNLGNKDEAAPGFTGKPCVTLRLPTFDEDYENSMNKIVKDFQAFQENGSGWILQGVDLISVSIARYQPIRGSTYIPTPRHFIGWRDLLVNVENNDNECFKWAILSCLYPPVDSVQKVDHYLQYQDKLDFTGIPFPVKIDDIPKFEEINNIKIAVYILNDGEILPNPLVLPSGGFDEHVIKLLLIEKNDNYHYCWIKDFDGLLNLCEAEYERHSNIETEEEEEHLQIEEMKTTIKDPETEDDCCCGVCDSCYEHDAEFDFD